MLGGRTTGQLISKYVAHTHAYTDANKSECQAVQ